jgi:hypothetical protein
MRKRQTRFDATRGAVKHVCMELPRARSAGRGDAPWLCTRAPVVVAISLHQVLVNIDKRKPLFLNQATTIGALVFVLLEQNQRAGACPRDDEYWREDEQSADCVG